MHWGCPSNNNIAILFMELQYWNFVKCNGNIVKCNSNIAIMQPVTIIFSYHCISQSHNKQKFIMELIIEPVINRKSIVIIMIDLYLKYLILGIQNYS